MFTAAHETFWANARKALGDGPGTRALVEVLLLHRHLGNGDVLAGVAAALATAIDSATRVLRLPTIRDRLEEIAAAAQREQLSYLGFLAELVMAECDDRDRRRAASTTPGSPATNASTTSTSTPTRPSAPLSSTS